MRGARQTIGLLGLFGQGNLGNDGSLEAMIGFLRRARPQADLVCICSGPEVVERVYGLQTQQINGSRPTNLIFRAIDAVLLKAPSRLCQLIQAIRYARKMDILIVPGTGILDDFGEGPLGVPATLFNWSLAARLCGAKFVFVSIGAGPIHHPVSRWLLKVAARMAQYRSYRDLFSKEFMESIGFDTRNDLLFPDIAFELPSPERANRERGGEQPLNVGVGVMNYYGWRCDAVSGAQIHDLYIEKITRFIRWLLDRGYVVRLLIGDTDDMPAVDKILKLLASDESKSLHGRIIYEDAQSLQDVMNQIADTDVVVATRFHNVVCALKMARPTISVSYAKKNDVLMVEMGLGAFCQNIERLDIELLIEQFTKLLAEREKYVKNVKATNAAFKTSLQQQDELLLNKFL